MLVVIDRVTGNLTAGGARTGCLATPSVGGDGG